METSLGRDFLIWILFRYVPHNFVSIFNCSVCASTYHYESWFPLFLVLYVYLFLKPFAIAMIDVGIQKHV